ncbi:hypothetical protein D3C81_808710 [compost metagenome]
MSMTAAQLIEELLKIPEDQRHLEVMLMPVDYVACELEAVKITPYRPNHHVVSKSVVGLFDF